MEETADELELFRTFWLKQGADEVMLKEFVDWGGQDVTITQLAMPSQRGMLQSPRKHPCKFLWQSVVIAWDGRVVPCCYDYDTKLVLGDLRTSSLAEIWNSPAYVALRKAELEGRNFTDLCANCSQAPGHARDPNFGDGRKELPLLALPIEPVKWAA